MTVLHVAIGINYFMIFVLTNSLVFGSYKEGQKMITLDYYDDNTVRENAEFFTLKKIITIVIASCLSLGFSIYKLYKIEIEDNIQTVFFVTLLVTMIIFMMLYLFTGDCELYSRKDLMKLKRNYEFERKKVLEEHKYNYSIFTIDWHTIDKEILCDSFSVDNKGHVYIMNSDFDTVLDESENRIKGQISSFR